MESTATRAVSCDACGKRYRYKPELAGKKVKCPCGGRVRFPALESEDAEPRVDVALQQLAAVERSAPQYDEQEEAPAPAPPLPPARSTGSKAKPSLRAAREEIGHPPASGSDDKWKWWYFVGGGVFLLGFAVWKYIDLSQAEATGDSGFARVSGSDRTLYMIFGKWGVVVGTVLGGLIAIAIGLYQFKQQRQRA
jgi:hypothetical protein